MGVEADGEQAGSLELVDDAVPSRHPRGAGRDPSAHVTLADGANAATTLDALCGSLSSDFDIEHSTFQLETADRRLVEARSHA